MGQRGVDHDDRTAGRRAARGINPGEIAATDGRVPRSGLAIPRYQSSHQRGLRPIDGQDRGNTRHAETRIEIGLSTESFSDDPTSGVSTLSVSPRQHPLLRRENETVLSKNLSLLLAIVGSFPTAVSAIRGWRH